MKARQTARGKCYACGAEVGVLEELQGQSVVLIVPTETKNAVVHTWPPCETFLRSESDAYARQCNLKACDEITEALEGLFK